MANQTLLNSPPSGKQPTQQNTQDLTTLTDDQLFYEFFSRHRENDTTEARPYLAELLRRQEVSHG